MVAGPLKTARELVRVVTAAGAQFAVTGDKLTITAPRPLGHELIEELRRAKADILRLLAAGSEATARCAPWGAAEEERAAIVEHDRGIPRAWAEGFARLAGPPVCPCAAGKPSLTMSAGSSIAGSPRRPQRSAGDRMSCLGATATGHLRGLIS